MTVQLGIGGAASSITAVGSPQNFVLNETVGWSFACFFQPVTLDSTFRCIIGKGNVGDTIRPLFLGACGSATFGTLNSLIYFPNTAGSWAISTTSALTVNHWYFAALTHQGTSTSSTTLSVYDLTSPAGKMATSIHGTMGGHDTDLNTYNWAMGVDSASSFVFSGYLSEAAFWQGVILPIDIARLAYRQRLVNDLPQQLIWWLSFDVSRLRGSSTTFNFVEQSRGAWPGIWKPSVAANKYSALQPPNVGMPLNRAQIAPMIMRGQLPTPPRSFGAYVG